MRLIFGSRDLLSLLVLAIVVTLAIGDVATAGIFRKRKCCGSSNSASCSSGNVASFQPVAISGSPYISAGSYGTVYGVGSSCANGQCQPAAVSRPFGR